MLHARKLALCSILLMMTCVFPFAAPANASASSRFNVLIEYGSPFTAHPGNKTSILTGCGCSIRFKRTSNAGRMVTNTDGEGAHLRLKKDEKVVRAFYTVKRVVKEESSEGSSEEWSVKPVNWNGKGSLLFEQGSCIQGRCVHEYLLNVTVFALLPHHPPYAKVRIEVG